MTNRIREVRAEKNMPQKDLARRAGIPQSTLSAVEAGKWVPSLEIAMKIAIALETQIENLFFL